MNVLTDVKVNYIMNIANYMAENAENYNLNKEEMYILGLLHDIGYISDSEQTIFKSADILTKVGFKYSKLVISQRLTPVEYIEQNKLEYINDIPAELWLLWDANLHTDASGSVSYDEKLEGIKNRHGVDSKIYKRYKSIIDFLTNYPFSIFKDGVRGKILRDINNNIVIVADGPLPKVEEKVLEEKKEKQEKVVEQKEHLEEGKQLELSDLFTNKKLDTIIGKKLLNKQGEILEILEDVDKKSKKPITERSFRCKIDDEIEQVLPYKTIIKRAFRKYDVNYLVKYNNKCDKKAYKELKSRIYIERNTNHNYKLVEKIKDDVYVIIYSTGEYSTKDVGDIRKDSNSQNQVIGREYTDVKGVKGVIIDDLSCCDNIVESKRYYLMLVDDRYLIYYNIKALSKPRDQRQLADFSHARSNILGKTKKSKDLYNYEVIEFAYINKECGLYSTVKIRFEDGVETNVSYKRIITDTVFRHSTSVIGRRYYDRDKKIVTLVERGDKFSITSKVGVTVGKSKKVKYLTVEELFTGDFSVKDL